MKIMFVVSKETLSEKRMASLLMKIKTAILLGHEIVVKHMDFSEMGSGQEATSMVFDEAETLPSAWASKLKGASHGKSS